MRAEQGWRLGLVFCLMVLPACLLPPGIDDPFEEDEPSGAADGAECREDGDCKSRGCLYSKLCAPSFCNCNADNCPAEGGPSSDCAGNQACVYYEDIFESVGEVFNIEHDMNGGYCRPLCEKGCPEHFICADGRFCEADSNWAHPVPMISWSGPATGMGGGNGQTHNVEVPYDVPVSLMGSGTSPLDQEIRLEWTITSSQGSTMATGETAEIMVTTGHNFERAELHAIDEEGRSGIFTVIFEGCTSAGGTCGYEGSGCCNGCDRDANTCL